MSNDDWSEQPEGIALLQCAGKRCRGAITEHHDVNRYVTKCSICGALRNSRVITTDAFLAAMKLTVFITVLAICAVAVVAIGLP